MSRMKWWLPIFLVLLITPFTPFIDMAIENYFYNVSEQQFISNNFTSFLFDYGVMPGWIVAIGALLLLIFSFITQRYKEWRRPALFLVLTLAIASGVIVHALLKDHWGRPRPKQTIEFGGIQQFRPYYSPNFFHQPEPSKSFPCGHCSMGFYFFALYVLGKRLNNKRMAYIGLFIAISLGVLLSIGRMMQGGHYFSDTVLAALILWLTALILDWAISNE